MGYVHSGTQTLVLLGECPAPALTTEPRLLLIVELASELAFGFQFFRSNVIPYYLLCSVQPLGLTVSRLE